MVEVADRMRWGFVPAWVRFPSYLKCKFIMVPFVDYLPGFPYLVHWLLTRVRRHY